MYVADDLRGSILGNPRGLWSEGCYVGVPFNTMYNSIEDVADDCDNLKITSLASPSWWWSGYFSGRGKLQDIQWGSELGVKLMETLVLSRDAKRFLIQKLTHEGDVQLGIAFESGAYLVPALLVGLINYNMKRWVNKRYGKFTKKPIMWPFYLSTIMLGVFACDTLRRAHRTRVELDADRDTAKMGDDYIRGGIEYYEKFLKRNRYINQLLTEAGRAKIYADDGDYIQRRFRKPTTSLKERLKVILQVKEEKDKPKVS